MCVGVCVCVCVWVGGCFVGVSGLRACVYASAPGACMWLCIVSAICMPTPRKHQGKKSKKG